MKHVLHLTWAVLLLASCGSNPDVSAPTGLTALPDEGQVTLTWQDRSNNETGFSVYRQQVSQGVGAQNVGELKKVGSTPPNTEEYIDRAVAPGTLYRYGVSADGRYGPGAIIAQVQDPVQTPAAPSDVTLSSTSVEENQPAGTVVGSLSATDDDSRTFSYSLVAGEGDDDNASFSIVRNQLETKASFDFETKARYSILVEVRDEEDNALQKSFTVTVMDVDEADVTSAENLGEGSLRQALADAEAGDRISLAKGLKIVLTSGQLELTQDVTLEGNGATISGNKESRVLRVQSGANVVLEDLIIAEGNGEAEDEGEQKDCNGRGGGVCVEVESTLTLAGSSSIRGNEADEGGGLLNYGTFTLQDSSNISGNAASDDGGGAFNYGTFTLQNSSSISKNTAKGYAGGIDNWGTFTGQDSSSISGNTARIGGGGVSNNETFLLKDSASIGGNTANVGGGIHNYKGTLTLEGGASISGNTAVTRGGGIYSFSGTLNNVRHGAESDNNVFGNTPDQVYTQ